MSADGIRFVADSPWCMFMCPDSVPRVNTRNEANIGRPQLGKPQTNGFG